MLKFPEDIHSIVIRRYQNKRCEWLGRACAEQWPLEFSLGTPTEQEAIQYPDHVRRWVTAWQAWKGVGTLNWVTRHWKTLGIQNLPEKLCFDTPEQVAEEAGGLIAWQQAKIRYQNLVTRWPILTSKLSEYFDILANYSEIDFQSLLQVLQWIEANPKSNLYPRQLPISGINSKWLENRKKLLSDLVSIIRNTALDKRDFFKFCGLKQPPYCIRLRILDGELRKYVGGLEDITIPSEEFTKLELPVVTAFIVENLQTGLAFSDMPGSIVLMGLGFSVDVLAQLPFLKNARCLYWGDLDTHGFAILNRARSYLPHLQSLLMDEATLLHHKDFWVPENKQHASQGLSLLTNAEQAIYQKLKQQYWGQNIRLEQERVNWRYALQFLRF